MGTPEAAMMMMVVVMIVGGGACVGVWVVELIRSVWKEMRAAR